jgi:hypothetical protein
VGGNDGDTVAVDQQVGQGSHHRREQRRMQV